MLHIHLQKYVPLAKKKNVVAIFLLTNWVKILLIQKQDCTISTIYQITFLKFCPMMLL